MCVLYGSLYIKRYNLLFLDRGQEPTSGYEFSNVEFLIEKQDSEFMDSFLDPPQATQLEKAERKYSPKIHDLIIRLMK